MMNRKFTTAVLLAALFLLCMSVRAQNTWDKRESVGGSKRERGVGFSIGSRGYIGLGQDTLNQMLNDFWEFDPGTNSWSQKANFPGAARRDAAAFSIGTKGYVGTGIDNADAFAGNTHADFWEYDPATNLWTSKAPYPGNSGAGIYYSSGFSIGGKGYFCCGKEGSSSYSNELWQYNPLTNSWTAKAPFPGGVRYGGTAFVVGSYAYFGTGTDENVFTSDFYRYNPSTNVWNMISPFPGSGRFSCSSFGLANRGYLVFGTDGGYKDELWEYNPLTDYWTQRASYPNGERRSSVAFTIGSKAYAGTGKGFTGTRRDFYEYSAPLIIGISELSNEAISCLYPNPASVSATLQLSAGVMETYTSVTWELNDVQGRQLQYGKMENESLSIERNGLPDGLYFLIIRSEGKMIGMKKLVLQ